ncbi:MAG: hypothetical protein ACFE9S_07555 [Candidatus Hermodarchaeota archaeon]
MYWLITYVYDRGTLGFAFRYDIWEGNLVDWIEKNYDECRYIINAIRITEWKFVDLQKMINNI